MRNGRAATYLSLAGVFAVVALLCVVVAQLHGLEQKLVMQERQIRALGEATDRLGARKPAGGDSPGSAPAPADDQPAHVLHPEVPNFLEPKGLRWPRPGARLDGVLRQGWWYGNPKGFNPLLDSAQELADIIELLCSAPIADRNAWTNPNEWYGDAASRVEITDDFKEFTIYLRPHAKWQAPLVDLNDPKYAWLRGEHDVTAHDFVFALDIIMNPQVANGFLKNYYQGLESWKAIDDTTLVIRWKKKEYLNVETTLATIPIPRFLYAYDENGRPFPKETIGLRFNQHWYNNKGYVGNGAYRMTSFEPGVRMRLARDERYVGEKPAIKELVFPIYTDRTQTLLKLKAHELDLGQLEMGQYREEIQPYEHGGTPPKASPFFDGRIRHARVPRHGYYYIGWNLDRALFSDKRVRRAMTYALDREHIIDSVFAGLGRLAVGPYEAGSPANDPSIKPIPFDLNEAKKLLAEAGWQDTDGDGVLDKVLHPGDTKRSPFEFTLTTYASSQEIAALANIYKEDLLKIGVKMNVNPVEWSLMQKRMDEKNFDAYTGGWSTQWETDLYQIWHSSQADVPHGSNHVGFRNAEADRIIEKIRATFDRDERLRLFHAFHRLVHDEQPYTFLVSRTDVVCTWNDVKDVVFSKSPPSINTLPWSVEASAP